MCLERGPFVLFGTVTEAFWGLFVLLGTKNVLFGDLDVSPKNGDEAPFLGTSLGAKWGLLGLRGTFLGANWGHFERRSWVGRKAEDPKKDLI